MRFPRTLAFYTIREVLLYAVIGLVGVGSILLTQNLLRTLEDFAAFGLQARDVVTILTSLGTMLSAYAIPVAFLFGILVAVGRMSADSEILAMRALGVSVAQFTVPFVALAVLVSVATAILLADIEPNARQGLRDLAADLASRGTVIAPGRFHKLDRDGERLFFADSRNDSGSLEGVVISDRSNAEKPFTVVAERGHFEFEPGVALAHLKLEQGDIHFEPAGHGSQHYRRIAFEDFDYAFDMSDVLSADECSIRPPEMTTTRLREVLDYFYAHDGKPPDCVRVKTQERYEIQYHRRLALPFAPLLFALLGVSLGVRRSRGARSYGMLLCIALAFAYYSLLSFSTFLAEEGVLPASIGLWLPNAIFAAVSVPLMIRARRAEL